MTFTSVKKKNKIHVWTKGKTGPQHVQFVWWDGQQLQFCTHVLSFWTKRLLDAFCGNSQTWHQGHFPFRQNFWLEIPETFLIKWKGFPAIELRLQSHCLHEPFFRYLGFPFLHFKIPMQSEMPRDTMKQVFKNS